METYSQILLPYKKRESYKEREYREKIERLKFKNFQYISNPRNILDEVKRLHKFNNNGNKLVENIAFFLIDLKKIDLIDSYRVMADFIGGRLHVSYKWHDKGHDSITLSFKGKYLTDSSLRPNRKE